MKDVLWRKRLRKTKEMREIYPKEYKYESGGQTKTYVIETLRLSKNTKNNLRKALEKYEREGVENFICVLERLCGLMYNLLGRISDSDLRANAQNMIKKLKKSLILLGDIETRTIPLTYKNTFANTYYSLESRASRDNVYNITSQLAHQAIGCIEQIMEKFEEKLGEK